jgi:hypothetical protein
VRALQDKIPLQTARWWRSRNQFLNVFLININSGHQALLRGRKLTVCSSTVD